MENLAKRREALPHLAGVYFVTPTEQSARLILEDWKARHRLTALLSVDCQLCVTATC